VSVATNGTEGNDHSGYAGLVISTDGRYVAFTSYASNLAPGDATNDPDLFVRDRVSGTTELVSVDPAAVSPGDPSMSADGRYVAFGTGYDEILAYDRQLGTTEQVSGGMVLPPGHGGGFWYSYSPSISADGRYVAFAADYEEPLSGVPPAIYLFDRSNGTTEQVTGAGYCVLPSISADARYVAFRNGSFHVSVADRQAGTLQSVSAAGADSVAISADGRYVAYTTVDYNPGGGHSFAAFVHVHDFQGGITESICGGFDLSSGSPRLSADGHYVAYASQWPDLVPGDTNAVSDVFVRNRLGGTRFESLCDPGLGAVIDCPCANPPSGSGLGCDNSAGTGGATLAASGGAYFSSDSLVFATSGQRPSGTSILLQGDSPISNGVVFGQGVRCAGGSLRRLYVQVGFRREHHGTRFRRRGSECVRALGGSRRSDPVGTETLVPRLLP
jgi:Tol biopolymer transport system component